LLSQQFEKYGRTRFCSCDRNKQPSGGATNNNFSSPIGRATFSLIVNLLSK
jgi:hypothetical protein